MYCKHYCIRSKKGIRYAYCRLHKKEITFSRCQECDSKEYKDYKPMKSRTYKQAKREKERFSIIYRDLTKCCECGLKTGDYDIRINMCTHIEKNEIFSGSYRQLSIDYGMVAPMCYYCHQQFHKDVMMNLKYKVKFQKEFVKNNSLDSFINIFGQDFIYKLEQKKRGKDD